MSQGIPNIPAAVYTPPPVKGYRTLTQADVDLMNRVKALGEQCEALWLDVRNHINEQDQAIRGNLDRSAAGIEGARLALAEPGRWLAMGRTDMQTGLMKMTRAVAQPSTFA